MKVFNTDVFAIQFVHPGGEHMISGRDVKKGVTIFDWNKGGHKRKFMKANGQYVNCNGHVQNDDIYFWGEWEPWSVIHPLPKRLPQGDYPHFVHEPIFYKRSKYPFKCKRLGMNTDPFVFGDNFFYSLCQQYRKTGPTRLNALNPGSVVLFGSCKKTNSPDAYFALDTVFVVAETKSFTEKTFSTDLHGYVPKYYEIIRGISCNSSSTQKLVAYKGASFSSPFNGMYSFVPCKVGDSGKSGFERPRLTNIDLPCLISNALPQGFKSITSTIPNNYDLWKRLCGILHCQGFCEGVRMDYTII